MCSLDVVQPFATVRNRLYDCHMAAPIGSLPGGVIFGGLTCHVASFRMAGVALRDMWTCLVTCRKTFCEAGAILSCRFQNMHCIFRGRRSTSDVSCCLFFATCICRAARSGDKVQIARQALHFVRCDEIWQKPRTKHRF